MANATEYSMLFKLGAQLGKEFNSTFSSAQKTLSETQKQIVSLNKQQGDIAAYGKQQQAIEATNRKLSDLQKQYDNIQREIQETEGYSSALENKLIEKQRAIDKTSSSLQQQTDKLGRMKSALHEAGVDTDNLAGESEKLTSRLNDLADAQEKASKEAKEFGDNGVNAFDAIGSAIVASGALVLVNKLYQEFGECVKAAIEFESTMTGVAKTTDFTTAELSQMSKEIEELSLEIPATTKELGGISETAGQLGVAKKDLLDFTEIMAMLGTATNMTSEEAATLLAQFASITGMNTSDYEKLGSTIVALGNAFATTEKNIAEMSQTVAAAGSIAGMSEADILALSAAVTSLGITTQNGGTQMTKLISDINSAVSSGENLESWASVANKSADEFAKAWGDNAAQALNDFIIGLNSAYESGEDIYSMLAELGITETRMVTMITSLAKSGDRLTETLKLSGEAWRENKALSEEAEKRYATTESRITLLSNAYRNLQTTIGEQFTPELNALAEIGSDILQGIDDFSEANPAVVKSIIAITAEIAAFLLVYNGLIAAKKVYNTLKALGFTLNIKSATASTADAVAKGIQAKATTGAAAAQTGLNTAMAMNPIGLILIGISALTVGIIALSEAERKNADNVNNLTAASREQYNQLQELNAEYDEACASYGEASEQARALHGEMLLLKEDYESSKQTINEFNEAVKESTEGYYSFIDEHRKNISALNSEEDVLLALITRLELLEHQTNKTEQEKEKMLVLVDQLNEKLPQLGLSYDKVNDSLNSTAEAIRNVVEADIARKKYEENYNAYYEAVEKELELEKQLATAKANTSAAQKEYDALMNSPQRKQMLEEVKSVGDEVSGRKYAAKWGEFAKQIENVRLKVERYKKTQDGLQKTYNEALSTEEKLLDAMGLYKKELTDTSDDTEDAEKSTKKFKDALLAVQKGYIDVAKAASYYGVSSEVLQESVDDTAEYRQNLEEAVDAVNNKWYSAEEAAKIYGVTSESIVVAAGIQTTIDKINELSENYREVKDAAEQSIQGQYALWDVAAVVIAQSIGDINTALETQLSYWSDYNTDLASLLERTDDVEGLSEVIASFADGSEDSVNAIAGMASASDEDLRTMVSNWKKVQEQQESASESIAEIVTGYGEQIGELQSDLEDAVDGLNLDAEAASAAKATVDAYTKAIKDGTDEAVKAAETLASLVAAALQNSGVSVDISNPPGGTTPETSSGAWKSYEDAASDGFSNIRTKNEFARGNNADKQKYGTYQSYLDGKYEKYVLNQAYAVGTNSAAPGVALVGEKGPELVTFSGGEKVYTAKETQEFIRYMRNGSFMQAYADGTGEALQIITILPLIQSYMEAIRNYRNEAQSETASAERITEQRIIITVSPSFTIEGNSTDGLEDRLRDFAEEIKQEVMDAIEDAGIDAKRGAYV